MAAFDPNDWWANATWIIVLSYCWFCIGGTSHELVHGNPIFGSWSTSVGRAVGILMLIPRSVYHEVHMRHHAYLNTPLDWEMWPYTDPGRSRTFRRIFLIFDVLIAVFVTPIVWGRICFSRYSPVSPELKRTMKREYAALVFFWASVVIACVWLHKSNRFTFRVEHWIFVLPPLLATMMNGCRKIIDHVGTRSIDPIRGTRTIVGKNVVTRVFSFFNFELAVHGPHHRFPRLGHTKLKQRMNELCEENPNHTYPVYPSFFAAIIDTIKQVIVNPGVGLNAGCTDDLSHLPMNQSACGPFDPRPRSHG